MALEPFDLVLLEQEFDPAGQAFTDLVLLAMHGAEVERACPRLDAKLARARRWRFLELSERAAVALEGMQPTLRQVPPSVSRLSTHAVFSPQLRRADRRDIAAGAGTDHDTS
jgi:hypothetical protein